MFILRFQCSPKPNEYVSQVTTKVLNSVNYLGFLGEGRRLGTYNKNVSRVTKNVLNSVVDFRVKEDNL